MLGIRFTGHYFQQDPNRCLTFCGFCHFVCCGITSVLRHFVILGLWHLADWIPGLPCPCSSPDTARLGSGLAPPAPQLISGG